MNNAKRILILGLPGAGKTTLARELSLRYQIPHIEADKMYWLRPGQARPENDFLSVVTQATAADSWIYEGHFKTAKNILSQRVTEVVYLDVSPAVSFMGLLRREWRDTGLVSSFVQDSGALRFFLGHHRFLRQMQREAFAQFANNPTIKTLHLTSRRRSLDRHSS